MKPNHLGQRFLTVAQTCCYFSFRNVIVGTLSILFNEGNQNGLLHLKCDSLCISDPCGKGASYVFMYQAVFM